MALVNLGNDPWLTEYDACDKLQQEIMEQLSARNKEQKSSQQYNSLSAAIRLRLKQFHNEVGQLKRKLEDVWKSGSLTREEMERRNRQIEFLQSKYIQMQGIFEGVLKPNMNDRRQLMGVGDLGRGAWGENDSNDISIDVGQIQVAQRDLLQEQENGLEHLSKIISRQKNIAQTISNEVDLHNEIIDDLGDHIERTDGRVLEQTQQVRLVSVKDRTCGYWVVIILLFISIVIVGIV